MMNPLETFYATLAACAAVFATKACKDMGCADDGIDIAGKPFAGPGGPYGTNDGRLCLDVYQIASKLGLIPYLHEPLPRTRRPN